MSIQVTDFKYEKGKNDAKYIDLLEKTLKNEQVITAKAVAKVRELATENEKLKIENSKDKIINEFARQLKRCYPAYDIDLCLQDNAHLCYTDSCVAFKSYIDEIAEQMKAGGKNE